VGHLSRIEKVRWIPVLECTDRQHVIDGFAGVFFLARPSVCKTESVNPVKAFSADVKQPGADLSVREHRFAGTIFRLFENVPYALLKHFVLCVLLFQTLKVFILEHQSRMAFFERFQDGRRIYSRPLSRC
jgi:hypothetical protein